MDSNTELKMLQQEEEQLKARIEEVRKLINETNEKIIFESWSVKVGLMVRDNTGKEGCRVLNWSELASRGLHLSLEKNAARFRREIYLLDSDGSLFKDITAY